MMVTLRLARAALVLGCAAALVAIVGCRGSKGGEAPGTSAGSGGQQPSSAAGDREPSAEREKLVVSAEKGLNLREEPDQSAKVIVLIPDGQIVELLEQKAEEQTIGEARGRWTRVSWQGTVGWAFGGYLLPKAELEYQRQVAAADFGERIQGRWSEPEGFYYDFRADGSVNDSRPDGVSGSWSYDPETWVLTMQFAGEVQQSEFSDPTLTEYTRVWRITTLTDEVLEFGIVEEVGYPVGVTKLTRSTE